MKVTELVTIVSPFIGLTTTVIAWRHSSHFNNLNDRSSVKEIRNNLKQKSNWYQTKLKSLLDAIDRQFSPNPFSANMYGACLRLAIAYILSSIIIIWFLSGENTSGINNALPAGQGAFTRLFAIIFCALATFSLFSVTRKVGAKALIFSTIAILLSWAASYIAVGEDFAVISGVTSAAIVSAICIFAPPTGPKNSSTGKAFLITGLISAALAAAIYSATSWVPALTWGLSIAVVATGAGLVSYAWREAEERDWITSFYIAMWLVLAAVVVGVFLPPLNSVIPLEGKLLAVFWVLLPLLNAPFDWLSQGLTRLFLRRTVNQGGRRALLNAVLDAASSLAMLVALACFVTAALSGINFLSARLGLGRPIAVAEILTALRRDTINWHMAWVYVMIGSTFLPTLVHALAASSAFSTWLLRRKLESRLTGIFSGGKAVSAAKRRRAAILLTIRDLASVIIPIIAVGAVCALVYYFLPQWGRGILWCCEFIANALGEPVTIGS